MKHGEVWRRICIVHGPAARWHGTGDVRGPAIEFPCRTHLGDIRRSLDNTNVLANVRPMGRQVAYRRTQGVIG